MLKILFKDEAFFFVNQSFKNLKEKIIIDICHDEKRYPAIVLSIDKHKRSFTILPLELEKNQLVVNRKSSKNSYN